MRCAKEVSEANGFAREVMESNILALWKSLFNRETKEAWYREMIRDEILSDLFQPLLKQEDETKH